MKAFIRNEKGSILAIVMFCLLILSILGIFAITTSDYELSIAGNQQRFEENFNTAEGGSGKEGAGVGYAGINGQYTWYMIADPENHNVPLFPSSSANYDPSGNDMPIAGNFPNDFNMLNINTWPRENLLSDIADNVHDYAYLVTYLFPDAAPKGTDATKFSSYKFRINGQRQVVIEMGGIKVGVKNPL